ncbi:unnamed protein product [Dicrocoelium dendriticum]|nr:unnamed protein product [Dicrocoelium dendriticum]
MCRSEACGFNPFTDFFVQYLKTDAKGKMPFSALYVLHSIFSQPQQLHEFSKYTLLQILSLPVNINDQNLDWDFMQSEPQSTDARLPPIAACGVSCVVSDKDVPSSNGSWPDVSSQNHQQCLELLLSQEEPVVLEANLRPEFMRVAPPLLPCPQGTGAQHVTINRSSQESDTDRTICAETSFSTPISDWHEELIWLNPLTVRHDFHWDASAEQATPTAELRYLITKALSSGLSQSEQHTVLQVLSENPDLVHNLGISPDNLSALVNRSPVIAIEVLSVLVNSPQKDEYYNALVSMEVTVDSLEIVNRLASRVELPKDFIHAYISKCMGYCESLQDKSSQSRHVRLVCVLIQSFIRNKILDIRNENILIEVQVFCVEFSKVAGASQLYRLIKNMESSSAGTSQSTPDNVTNK